jgi:hypothetical protein
VEHVPGPHIPHNTRGRAARGCTGMEQEEWCSRLEIRVRTSCSGRGRMYWVGAKVEDVGGTCAWATHPTLMWWNMWPSGTFPCGLFTTSNTHNTRGCPTGTGTGTSGTTESSTS